NLCVAAFLARHRSRALVSWQRAGGGARLWSQGVSAGAGRTDVRHDPGAGEVRQRRVRYVRIRLDLSEYVSYHRALLHLTRWLGRYGAAREQARIAGGKHGEKLK